MWAHFLGVDYLGTALKVRKRKKKFVACLRPPQNEKVGSINLLFF